MPLSVTADPAIVTAVRRLAPALLDPARASDRMCVRVDVLEAASADVAAQLAAPGGNAVAVPQVWIPDSSHWIAMARTTAEGISRVGEPYYPLVALNPVVIAMQPAMATRLEASGPKFGWHTLAEASRKKGDDMRLALPDPARSAAGVVTLRRSSTRLDVAVSAPRRR